MALHGLASVTIGVPDVAATRSYYTDFGLTSGDDGWLSTTDGGRQLRLVERPRRQLVDVVIRADDSDDLARIASTLRGIDAPFQVDGDTLTTHEPVTGTRVAVRVLPRLRQPVRPAAVYNGPGRVERSGRRADGVMREGQVRPRRLGHAVLGVTDLAVAMRFFTEGLGFRVSDYISDKGAFLRCSDEHHNILVLAAPVNFLHHTSWQVDDIDEIGRGATAMLEDHPERHVWGLGRHHAGSNFFWYLKDPAGNFSEYFSDMDCDIDDALWTPEVFEGAQGLFNWGPPPPPSFLRPDDLADLMIGSHSSP
ncbi:Glyoxalase/Bleomycin resistance protein/Dioxygenase superfamily protein [Sinosporangium album]|uniref:Glyoxalase/Bleomycin resistance protein/Dioxygenase superfamily protein n=1 Tax=Sinosporangium album TaxID=504805 RepID=A0A1G8L9S0_9ACTN|nr:VOC family protein [Sinosporangium album]SDI52449.1 Glyoxalase/Bleomycin resistance protein/Dioxygenase superfamily protein [Sinosporangium album]